MRIRTDFVTNSSSASYVLELTLETNDGKFARTSLAVSLESCGSDDGYMTARDIFLGTSEMEDDILVDKTSIFSAKDIDALCDLLFSAATIEGWEDLKDEDDEFEDEIMFEDSSGRTVSVIDVAPKTLSNFKKECKKSGVTLENLKSITILNAKSGWGESAMYVDGDNKQLAAYRMRYQEASEDEKETIVQEFLAFVKSEPELDVVDNGCRLPDTVRCTWNLDDSTLEQEMRKYLKRKRISHWMGEYGIVETIDISEKTLDSKERLFLSKFW